MFELLNQIFRPEHANPLHCHLYIHGRIYDGSYHVFAERAAREHSVDGIMSVRGAFTSTPYIEMDIEATKANIDAYLNQLRLGPRDSSISRIKVEVIGTGRKKYDNFRRVQ